MVDCEPVGTGAAAFKYLAAYVFRVAISNNRILKLEDGVVTFKYQESATGEVKFCPLPAHEFIRRFLQHVLPPRFIKVRYYGLLSPAQRPLLLQARLRLSARMSAAQTTAPILPAQQLAIGNRQSAMLSCPRCRAPLTLLALLAPRGRPP